MKQHQNNNNNKNNRNNNNNNKYQQQQQQQQLEATIPTTTTTMNNNNKIFPTSSSSSFANKPTSFIGSTTTNSSSPPFKPHLFLPLSSRTTTTTPNKFELSPSTTTTGAAAVLSGDYGLLGLLGIIRVSDGNASLALGTDLTRLELELNSSEPLYTTFAGPWATNTTNNTKENKLLVQPYYSIPPCYYTPQVPPLKTGHLAKFPLETLFYIFYAIPQDILQAYAAQELYARDWNYHKELKIWMIRNTNTTTSNTIITNNNYSYSWLSWFPIDLPKVFF
mmetsp:Transcript_2079/g.3202  ORF Transcript_2079/g.3202 Transcript_2079/m.3202 type:complete len:278 (-) Transcript_2079:65-898(-)